MQQYDDPFPFQPPELCWAAAGQGKVPAPLTPRGCLLRALLLLHLCFISAWKL